MSRKIIPVSHPQLTPLDLDAFVRQAKALNQQNRDRFTAPFPKHASHEMSSLFFGETGEVCPQSAPCTSTYPQVALKLRVAGIILQVPQ